MYAIASGGCAALNGAFAKLTTTQLTTTWAAAVSRLVGLEETNVTVEYVIRAVSLLHHRAPGLILTYVSHSFS